MVPLSEFIFWKNSRKFLLLNSDHRTKPHWWWEWHHTWIETLCPVFQFYGLFHDVMGSYNIQCCIMNWKGSGRKQSLAFAWWTEGNSEGNSMAEIQTEDISNTSPEHYCYTSRFHLSSLSLSFIHFCQSNWLAATKAHMYTMAILIHECW